MANSRKYKKLKKKIKNESKKLLKFFLLSKVFQKSFRYTAVTLAVFIFGYFAISFLSNKVSNNFIVSESEIISRISKHVTVPVDAPEYVVRVDDAENLRKQNDFFKDVKEGDYIIAYKNRVIIYDLKKNKIISEK